MGGLDLANPSEPSSLEYEASITVTEPLVQRIFAQDHQPRDAADMQSAKSQAGAKKNEVLKGFEEVFKSSLTPRSLRAAEVASEKGTSSWLTVIPIQGQGYDLNKREFKDAIKMKYNWEISDLPKTCVCGDIFDVDHAMICKRGGFVIQRHNELRDLGAELLSTVCKDVQVEPVLQQVTGETLNRGANRAPDAPFGYPRTRDLGETKICIHRRQGMPPKCRFLPRTEPRTILQATRERKETPVR